MASHPPRVLGEPNLSHAWGRLFLLGMDEHREKLNPVVVSFEGFEDSVTLEEPRIRATLDEALQVCSEFSCNTTAMTIFPFKHWIRSGRPGVDRLSEWYLEKFLPRLRARDHRNAYGTYFERIVAFSGVLTGGSGRVVVTRNQLGSIIGQWRKAARAGRRPRQSALQMACLDPAKDHTGQALRGFPCLQQISFNYDEGGGLALNAFYPCQYIFERAYGNYLGLSHLGHFMARELDLKLVRVNCFIARPELGAHSKKSLRPLRRKIIDALRG